MKPWHCLFITWRDSPEAHQVHLIITMWFFPLLTRLQSQKDQKILHFTANSFANQHPAFSKWLMLCGWCNLAKKLTRSWALTDKAFSSNTLVFFPILSTLRSCQKNKPSLVRSTKKNQMTNIHLLQSRLLCIKMKAPCRHCSISSQPWNYWRHPLTLCGEWSKLPPCM